MPTLQELEQMVFSLYDTRDQLKRFVYDRADEAFARGDAVRDSLETVEAVRERRRRMQAAFFEAIGGLPSADTPLAARTTATLREPGLTIENVLFDARPHHPVAGNLYIPENASQPGAALLFLCGHEPDSRFSPLYQRVCRQLAAAGLIVLAIDPIGQGERLGYPLTADGDSAFQPGTHEHQHVGAQCLPLGEPLARYFVHDAMRAIDYLCSRPEVDPQRIGVTGNSGGGTQTSMLMALDERLAAAAPATFIMNRQQFMHAGGVQDAEQVWPGLTAAGFDHEDLLLLFAPRPLHVLAVSSDFFPIEATQRTVERARKYWQLEGAESSLELTVDDSTHSYTVRLGEAAAAFFSRVLLGRPYKVSTEIAVDALLPARQLWATASGQVLADYPQKVTVHRANIARARELAELRHARSSEDALAWLGRRLLGPRRPARLGTRKVPLGRCGDAAAEYRLWWSQEGLMNSGILLTPRIGAAAGPPVIGLWEGGSTALASHEAWIAETISSGRAVLVFNPSGVGPHLPHPIHDRAQLDFFGVVHKLADELLWLGDSLAAMRAYDVIRCVDMLLQDASLAAEAQVEIRTHGRYELYARLAAGIDRRIGTIRAEAGIGRIEDWVCAEHYEERDSMSLILPGMLRYFDLDELASWRAQDTTTTE